jgi:hypothetical protein
MTTNQQRRLYFPAWQLAAKNHGWHKPSVAPSLHRPIAFFGTPELNPIYQRIVQIAHERASARPSQCKMANAQCSMLNEVPPPSPDDYRHACHLVAFGRDLSSSALSNAQLDRILALFKLLADPDDLAAWLTWNNPQESARTRLLYWLRNNCVESYIVQLSRERFHTANWESLDYADLRQLHMTLKNRQNSRKTPGGSGRAATTRERPASAFVNVSRNTEPETEPEPF